MCLVSLITEDWSKRSSGQVQTIIQYSLPITREEFDALKKEVEALKELLLAAKKYDEETGQPDCEDVDKVKLFRQLADYLDVDLSTVFLKKSSRKQKV